MTHATSRILSLFLALLVAMTITVARAAQAPDPFVGKWYGHAGFPTDRVELGFEFKVADNGAMSAALYGAIFNFYGLMVPGGLVRDSDGSYVNQEWGIKLAVKKDEVDGVMFGKMPVTLHRVDTLPSEAPMPVFSAGPGPKWQTKLANPVYARAALRDGIAYVGTAGGEFHAINVKDGSFKWTFSAGRGVYGEALVTDDAVYFVCDNGFLFKLDRATGKELWRYDLGDERVARILPHQLLANSGSFDWDFHGAKPVLADGVVYVGSGDGGMNAVAAADGKRIWRFQADGKIRAGALVDGSRLFFGTMSHFAYALDRKSGAQLWRIDTQGPIEAAPSMIGNTLVLSIAAGLIAGRDPLTGKGRWLNQPWLSAVDSSAVPDKGTRFFIGSSDMRRVSYMDAKDGRVIWRTDVYGWPWATPELSGDRLFISTASAEPYFAGVDAVPPYPLHHRSSLSALDRKSGEIIWRWQVPDAPGAWLQGFVAQPAADTDTVVVGGVDGTLYGFPSN